MEKVFESFVAAKLKQHAGALVRVQDGRYSLFGAPRRAFCLRQDVVLEKEKRVVVLDTKWRLLSDQAPHFGISHVLDVRLCQEVRGGTRGAAAPPLGRRQQEGHLVSP